MPKPIGQSKPLLPGGTPLNKSNPRWALWLSLSILVGLLVVGMIGFRLLNTERSWFDAMYATANVLTTVGDASLDYSSPEQAWALILMLAGIGAALYAAGNVVAFVVEGELRDLIGRRKVQTKIERQENHVIVCGFGRMGSALCKRLKERGEPFVIIESHADRAAVADGLGYLCVEEDAMSEQTLVRAGIERAERLVTCLADDANNVLVTLTARGLNERLQIIARAEREQTYSKLHRAGADGVVCPPLIGAMRISQMLLEPAVARLLEMAISSEDELEFAKVDVAQLPQAVGKTLRDLELLKKTGMLVIAISRGEQQPTLNPPPQWKLDPSDELIVTGPGKGIGKMMQIYG